MANSVRPTYPERLTKAGHYLTGLLEALTIPIVTPFTFYCLIGQMYQEKEGKRLYLRRDEPNRDDYDRLRRNLTKAGLITNDRDYGGRVIRIATVPDLPAEDIVCLADPICYVSHLSAMQRWGLTNRHSDALIITRPDRRTAGEKLKALMEEQEVFETPLICKLKNITHPSNVRKRPIHPYETKSYGAHLNLRGTHTRIATIGQTFLDMLQKPDLCGGMAHVLDVWEENAQTYLNEVIASVDGAQDKLVKSRAGYVLEERLGIVHETVEAWKAFGQRGGSRKLDPTKDFAPTFSETWMISLNV